MKISQRRRLLLRVEFARIIDSCDKMCPAFWFTLISSESSCARHPTRALKPQRQHTIISSLRPTCGAFERRIRDVDAVFARLRRLKSTYRTSLYPWRARPLAIGSDRARDVTRRLMHFSTHSIVRDDKNSRLVEPRAQNPD